MSLAGAARIRGKILIPSAVSESIQGSCAAPGKRSPRRRTPRDPRRRRPPRCNRCRRRRTFSAARERAAVGVVAVIPQLPGSPARKPASGARCPSPSRSTSGWMRAGARIESQWSSVQGLRSSHVTGGSATQAPSRQVTGKQASPKFSQSAREYTFGRRRGARFAVNRGA